jgi:peptidase MA superfamily protein/tetratricopeptide repeat protein
MRGFLFVAFLTLALGTALGGTQRSAAQLAKTGWDALNAGRVQEAAVAFDEALKATPQQPRLLLGAGVAARLQGRMDDARRFLVDALRADPGLTAASLLLGSVLYQADDIDGAIDTYQRALAIAPDHPQLTKQLAAWRKEALLHSGFGRKLGDHFTVLFEGPAEADLADRAVAILEAAYWRIGTAVYTYPTDVITVILYTREQFRDVTRSPEWAGGAFDGRIRVPVQGALQNRVEFERVLAHEFTHALIQSIASRGVPVWLHEGLADCFDGTDLTRKEEQVRKAETLLPLRRLEESFAGLSAKDASLAYAESAVAVRLLLDQAGVSAVVNLLGDLGRGTPLPEAFQRNIPMSYAEFQNRLQKPQEETR